MTKILSIFILSVIPAALFSQVAIGKDNTTNASVSLEFSEGKFILSQSLTTECYCPLQHTIAIDGTCEPNPSSLVVVTSIPVGYFLN